MTELQWKKTSFMWRIMDLNMAAKLPGEFICSPEFSLDTFGCTKFCLSLYPRGMDESDRFITVCLVKKKSNDEPNVEQNVCLEIKFSFKKDVYEPKFTTYSTVKLNKDICWKVSSIAQNELSKYEERIYYSVNLRLFFTLKEILTEESVSGWECNNEDLDSLSSDISSVFEDQMHWDLILKDNEGKSFKAHKAILTVRYPDIASNLSLQESENEYLLRDMKSPLSEKFLKYLYSGKFQKQIGIIYPRNKSQSILHLQQLLFPAPDFTYATTAIQVQSGSLRWTIRDFKSVTKYVSFDNLITLDYHKSIRIRIIGVFFQRGENNINLGFVVQRMDSEEPADIMCIITVDRAETCPETCQSLTVRRWKLPLIRVKFLNYRYSLQSDMHINVRVKSRDGTHVTRINNVKLPVVTVEQMFPILTNMWAFQRDLRNLCENPVYSDFTFLVGEEKYQAHRAILSARSPVFCKMFEHESIEKQSGEVIIEDFEPEVVKTLLKYIYCGDIEEKPHDLCFAMDLYSISDKYEIQALKKKCAIYFKSVLSTDNAADILLLADAHFDECLMTYVKEFAALNKMELSCSVEWGSLMKEREDLADKFTVSSTLLNKKI